MERTEGMRKSSAIGERSLDATGATSLGCDSAVANDLERSEKEEVSRGAPGGAESDAELAWAEIAGGDAEWAHKGSAGHEGAGAQRKDAG